MPRSILYLLSSILLCCLAADWPQWGRDSSRNMVSSESSLPTDFDPGKTTSEGELDRPTMKNVKWAARLGSYTYGNPVAAKGKVYVGTNNEPAADPRFKGDYSMLLCIDESSGKRLWQLAIPKLEAGKNSDYDATGLCSSPSIDGDRGYLVTNRCEVICIDTNGLANGNDGPFVDEAQYVAGKNRPKIEVGPTDGDIIWRYDLRDELGVFPIHMTSSSVLIAGDRLYVTTSNGQDWTGHVPSPNSPALICLDKKTGKLLGQEMSGISGRTLMCNWSSPALANVGGRELIIFGAGDGLCYGFEAQPTRNEKGEDVLKEVWRCDVNPPEYRRQKYGSHEGPSEIIATPVVFKNRVYIAVGQNPEQGDGIGALACIDAATGAKLWTYTKIGRSLSTVAIANDLLFAADFDGRLHCLNPDNGEQVWMHDTASRIWGSPLVGDGKVYIGNEAGELTILAAVKEKKQIAKIGFDGAIYSTPITANGTMFIATDKFLYAIGAAK